VINTGTLAILVIIVTSACGLGYMLGRCIWSAYRGWKPSYIYCSKCNIEMGLQGIEIPPHYIPPHQRLIASTVKAMPNIQVMPSDHRHCNESATMNRLGMKETLSGFNVQARDLEAKILSPVQESPHDNNLNSRVERLTPSPTPLRAKQIGKACSSGATPAFFRGTPTATVGRDNVIRSFQGNEHEELHTSIDDNTELLYDYDKNNQVRVLTIDNGAKTPGNASTKRPLRPSGSVKSRRSLIWRTAGLLSRSHVTNSGGVVTQTSELDPSEAESRTPLLEADGQELSQVQSSKSVRNQGSPGNTTDLSSQLKAAKFFSVQDIDIEDRGPRPEQSDKKSHPVRTGSKKLRKPASIRQQSSHYINRRYIDSDITSQSEDERGRAPLKMGVLFPANHKEGSEVNRQASSHQITQPQVFHHHEQQNQGLRHCHQDDQVSQKNQLQRETANIRGGRLEHITTRRYPRSPQINQLPIVDHQQLITLRSSPIDEERMRLEDSFHKDVSSNIELQSFKISPDKSNSSHLPTSSDNSRVQSASPHLLSIDQHHYHRDIGRIVHEQELTSSGVHSGQSVTTSVNESYSPGNLPQNNGSAEFLRSDQPSRIRKHLHRAQESGVRQLTPHSTSKRSPGWNYDKDIPYPHVSVEIQSPNQTSGSNKSSMQAAQHHGLVMKTSKERRLPEKSFTFIPEIDEHADLSSLPGYTGTTDRLNNPNADYLESHSRVQEIRNRLQSTISQQSGCSEETLKGSQSSHQGQFSSMVSEETLKDAEQHSPFVPIDRPTSVIVRSPSTLQGERPDLPPRHPNFNQGNSHRRPMNEAVGLPENIATVHPTDSGNQVQRAPSHFGRLGSISTSEDRRRLESASSADVPSWARRNTDSSQAKSLDWDGYESAPHFYENGVPTDNTRELETDSDDLFGEASGGVQNSVEQSYGRLQEVATTETPSDR